MRVADWDERLHVTLDEAALRPFAWGDHDCALFAADVVLAITGDDFGAPFRGRYSTARGAAQALRDYGAGTLIRTMTAALGAPIHPAHAHRGDVAMADGNAGICVGGTAVFLTEGGLLQRPRATWSRAWPVGRPAAGAPQHG